MLLGAVNVVWWGNSLVPECCPHKNSRYVECSFLFVNYEMIHCSIFSSVPASSNKLFSFLTWRLLTLAFLHCPPPSTFSRMIQAERDCAQKCFSALHHNLLCQTNQLEKISMNWAINFEPGFEWRRRNSLLVQWLKKAKLCLTENQHQTRAKNFCTLGNRFQHNKVSSTFFS